jgi:hypothetical protein
MVPRPTHELKPCETRNRRSREIKNKPDAGASRVCDLSFVVQTLTRGQLRALENQPISVSRAESCVCSSFAALRATAGCEPSCSVSCWLPGGTPVMGSRCALRWARVHDAGVSR